MKSRKIIVCVTGMKGEIFVSGLLTRRIRPDLIISYDQADDLSKSFAVLSEIAARENIEFSKSKYTGSEGDDLILVVGWQRLLKYLSPFTVVFHDSLLPRYRGFAPTVSALINGEHTIGVTALKPSNIADHGRIFGQASVQIEYPIKIAQALKLQTDLIVELAIQIHRQWLRGALKSHEQDGSRATYSVWRDGSDYQIDWSLSAEAIRRFVDAVGYPYAGAQTWINKDRIVVEDVSVVEDLYFEQRHVGKLWRIDDGRPIVVCGSGLLRIDEAYRSPSGERYEFRRLRVRMGRPSC